MRQFLARKNIEFSLTRYGIEAMGAMTLGLFASLIIGSILREIGTRAGITALAEMGTFAMGATGYAIGMAVAYGLKAPPLVLFAAAAAGFAGNIAGGVPGAFLAAVVGTELGKAISKETPVDIIITPSVTIASGYFAAMLAGPPINQFMIAAGQLIMWATELVPFAMGAVVAVIMGMILTAPISSAALAIMLDLQGIAAGAAVAGCAANMVGFAVSSYRENKINGLLSQGLGTSMLQFPNIIKNPRIWIPPIIASAVCGVVSAAVFGMENTPTGAGMGTSGLVGQFGALTAMGYNFGVFGQIALVHFVLPAIISLAASEWLRKKGWIKFGDMEV